MLKPKSFLKPYCSLSTPAFSYSSESQMETAFRLITYASTGNVKSLEDELQAGSDLNASDYDQRTAFHIAAASGQLEVVKWFMHHKVPYKLDRFGCTPQSDAIRNNHYQLQKLFNQYNEEISKSNTQEQINPKQEQMDIVFELLIKENIFNYSLIAKNVDWFFNKLGFDQFYFKTFSASQIAKHISFLISAQNLAEIKNQPENLQISLTSGNQSFFICSDMNIEQTEKEIEKTIKSVNVNICLSVMHIQSQNPILPNGNQKLNIYTVTESNYENPHLIDTDNLYLCANQNFIQKRDKKVLIRYQSLIQESYKNPQPIIKTQDQSNNGKLFLIAANFGRTINGNDTHSTFLIQLGQIFQQMQINVNRKFVETFSNGIVIYSIYTDQNCSQKEIDDIVQLTNDILNIPDTIFRQMLINKQIDGEQAIYLQTCVNFIFYFMNNHLEDFDSLNAFLQNDKVNQNKLTNIRQSLVRENVNFEKLYDSIVQNLPICLQLFENFQDLMQNRPLTHPDLDSLLQNVENSFEKQMIKTINTFNNSVVKTNFYNSKRSATSFRLNPQVFLKDLQLPEIPFGMYLIIGRDFTGMHIRFRDISRGGVRIIKSNDQNYLQNRMMQFNETFGLAYTQKKKNKDIPESGSKGTILMGKGKNHMSKQSFMQYVDAISDIMLNVPGTVDLDGNPELIFLGPDENSADLMDPACLFMKQKGYKMWKSFTTGKSPQIGGIPHDVYGMTTRSVRSYVKGIQKKLNLKEEECTKFMTGGPDGDLGSNEILMGNEKIVGVIDGSGVLYDPEGIEREPLVQLAKSRRMVQSFNGTLSPNGYLVLVSDENIKLPDGRVVESGLAFRNNFHLNEEVQADFFVPCGGRPESVNLQNVDKMYKKDGSPRFKYIVEGANLFFSEGARKKLESSGVILFKDSSTNKGGVTSSSFEVQAALSLLDQEFMKLMTIQNDKIDEFYKNYVNDICMKVEEKAELEFEYIWNEHKKTGIDNCVISDKLSSDMNNLADIIQKTDLFEDLKVRKNVMREVLPKSLQNLIGLDEILNRIPKNYQKSMFCKYIGAKYYYSQGSDSNIYNFYTFMKQYE